MWPQDTSVSFFQTPSLSTRSVMKGSIVVDSKVFQGSRVARRISDKGNNPWARTREGFQNKDSFRKECNVRQLHSYTPFPTLSHVSGPDEYSCYWTRNQNPVFVPGWSPKAFTPPTKKSLINWRRTQYSYSPLDVAASTLDLYIVKAASAANVLFPINTWMSHIEDNCCSSQCRQDISSV